MSKEEIEKAKMILQSYENKLVYEISEKDKKAVKTLLQYIDQLEQEINKQNEDSFEFEISEECAKKLHKMFEPLENAYNRFENGEETLDDLLKYYPSFKIQLKYNDGKQKELDVVEKKYYKKLIDFIDKQNKIIDEMAYQLSGLTILDIKKAEYITLGDIEGVKQYFEKKVEEK